MADLTFVGAPTPPDAQSQDEAAIHKNISDYLGVRKDALDQIKDYFPSAEALRVPDLEPIKIQRVEGLAELESELKGLGNQLSTDPTQDFLTRLKRVSGASSQEEYEKNRFESLYGGHGKKGAASRFLIDILGGATGHGTLREEVRGSAGKEFQTALKETQQAQSQERMNTQNRLADLRQRYFPLKAQQDTFTKEAEFAARADSENAKNQLALMGNKIRTFQAGTQGMSEVLKDQLAYVNSKYGGNSESQFMKALTQDLMRQGVSRGEAVAQAAVAWAQLRASEKSASSAGGTTITRDRVAKNAAGDIVGQWKESQRVPNSTTPRTPSMLTEMYPSIEKLFAQQRNSVRGVSSSGAPKDGITIEDMRPPDADKYRQVASGTAAQGDLLTSILNAGLQSDKEGFSQAKSSFGPFEGSDLITKIRRGFFETQPAEIMSVSGLTFIPFSAARQAVGSRVTQQEIQAARGAKPSTTYQYKVALGLAVANKIQADIEYMHKRSGKLSESVSVADQDKIQREIVRVLDEVGKATHGFDFSQKLDKTQATRLIQTMKVRSAEDILGSAPTAPKARRAPVVR